ncbi:unnamed protein product [Didymodactylos carnosus]|uniref:3CxxC-type domain-containing protein n=1 Tax=Didymodactylos carnosus TaxID=1234261 RepID=A0A813NS32_9BILA|nr:unnamed protein product [Didymodactylos carnosus]CAF3520218.1 unnamed protein product [Didymodactylos carnosus]
MITPCCQGDYFVVNHRDVMNALQVADDEKKTFYENNSQVMHAELEINLNSMMMNDRDVWSLIALDHSSMSELVTFISPHEQQCGMMQETYYYSTQSDDQYQQISHHQHILVLRNAKVKYICSTPKCMKQRKEWTTARGRALFLFENPSFLTSQHLIVYHLFEQNCNLCHQNVQPSWYLDETCRVIREIAQLIIMNFYPNLIDIQPVYLFGQLVQRSLRQRPSAMRRTHDNRSCQPWNETKTEERRFYFCSNLETMVGQSNTDVNPTLLKQKSVSETVVVSELVFDVNAQSLQRSKSSCDDIRANPNQKGKFRIKMNHNKSIVAPRKSHHSSSDSDSGIEDFRAGESIDTFKAIETSRQQYISISSKSVDECSIEDDDVKNLSSVTTTPRCLTPMPYIPTLHGDAELAANIPDSEKKDFCANTAVVFHAEFARLILAVISKYNKSYTLMVYDAMPVESTNIQYDFLKVDNAKAQFKCTCCGHAWTSMRARCSFHLSHPDVGIILLKVFNQICSVCSQATEPLWYIDEVCRVMKNLAATVFERYFPDECYELKMTYFGSHNDSIRQRKGTMSTVHLESLCEACQMGICFPKSMKKYSHHQ